MTGNRRADQRADRRAARPLSHRRRPRFRGRRPLLATLLSAFLLMGVCAATGIAWDPFGGASARSRPGHGHRSARRRPPRPRRPVHRPGRAAHPAADAEPGPHRGGRRGNRSEGHGRPRGRTPHRSTALRHAPARRPALRRSGPQAGVRPLLHPVPAVPRQRERGHRLLHPQLPEPGRRERQARALRRPAARPAAARPAQERRLGTRQPPAGGAHRPRGRDRRVHPRHALPLRQELGALHHAHGGRTVGGPRLQDHADARHDLPEDRRPGRPRRRRRRPRQGALRPPARRRPARRLPVQGRGEERGLVERGHRHPQVPARHPHRLRPPLPRLPGEQRGLRPDQLRLLRMGQPQLRGPGQLHARRPAGARPGQDLDAARVGPGRPPQPGHL